MVFFSQSEKIEIDDKSLVMIIGEMQGYALTETDRDVVGDAFEVFAERQFAGEKGQFFTPRAVVKMVVAMMNLHPGEEVMDPACGSGGFLIHALHVVWKQIGNVSLDEKSGIARNCFFGIDKEIDLVKICKAHMCLMGDGRSNIVKADSLKSEDDWEDEARDKLLKDRELRQYDVIITNPPFGTKIKVAHKYILKKYDLGYKWEKMDNGYVKTNNTVETPPQILFIERCLQMLKEGGRMAIILPDGIFGNSSYGHIRWWIRQRAEILAIVDCPLETFAPHTTTRTCVLFLRKQHQPQQKPVFFAIAEKCGHTLRGTPIYKDPSNTKEEIDEDFTEISQNYLQQRRTNVQRHLGFYVKNIGHDVWVPKFYDPLLLSEIKKLNKDNSVIFRTIRELDEKGLLEIGGFSNGPRAMEYSDSGSVRFIRTSDIGDYELLENSSRKVDEDVFQKYKKSQDLREHDILFVKEGDGLIGKTVILGKDDLHILVQSHLYKIRALKMDAHLLFVLLNSEIVKKQIRKFVFNQSTVSTIGKRIYDLRLPFPQDEKEQKVISKKAKKALSDRSDSRIRLRNEIDEI